MIGQKGKGNVKCPPRQGVVTYMSHAMTIDMYTDLPSCGWPMYSGNKFFRVGSKYFRRICYVGGPILG